MELRYPLVGPDSKPVAGELGRTNLTEDALEKQRGLKPGERQFPTIALSDASRFDIARKTPASGRFGVKWRIERRTS